jgi:16S rRNA (adenine1518-N6/adenine1519-N6)-dimethyltransferase
VKRHELIKVLTEYGIQPSKAKGQNFLVDQNMLKAMVRGLDLKQDERILEVGPGAGVLTRIIINAGCRLTSIEMDVKLHQYLTDNLIYPNFELVYGDACRVDYSTIFSEGEVFRCIANLPYAISSVFIAKMLDLDTPPTEMYFLLQKEMADRFSAKKDTKKYGSLTVRAGAMYDSKILRVVPPGVFHPPPKVDSAFIHMKLKDSVPPRDTLKTLNKLVRAAFSQRRKKAKKLISQQFPSDLVTAIYDEINLDHGVRAENISIEQYVTFAEKLNENKSN